MSTVENLLSEIPEQNSSYRATLFVQNEPPRHGCVASRLANNGGIFFPDNSDVLTTFVDEAEMEIVGLPNRIAISNIQQCPNSKIHWNFDLST